MVVDMVDQVRLVQGPAVGDGGVDSFLLFF